MYDQQPAQASAILTAADTVARNGDPQLATRQWVASVQAQAQASLGDSGACDRALDTAAGVLDLTASAHPGGWLRFDGSRIAEESGTCYLATGRDTQAETTLTQALSEGISPRRKGSLLTDLAMLGVRRHDTRQISTTRPPPSTWPSRPGRPAMSAVSWPSCAPRSCLCGETAKSPCWPTTSPACPPSDHRGI